MFRHSATLSLLAVLFSIGTVRSVTTNTNLRLVYGGEATLVCSSSEASTFYKTTKAGVVSTIAASATKYSFSGNTLVIKSLGNLKESPCDISQPPLN